MATKQQILPFQIRNPYRLDRPHFDPSEVYQTAIAEEEESHRAQLIHRPLPPQPGTNESPPEILIGAKRTKDAQKKSASKTGSDFSSQEANDSHHTHQQQQSSYSYFGQSWFGHGLSHRGPAITPTRQQSAQAAPPPVPAITITHHIDTHTELTFERHVEWLTQTALWWDMPVVHLYPAPETLTAMTYVETAASTFSSWVNFVKIPAGDESRIGPASLPVRSAQPAKVKGSRVIKTARRGAPRDMPATDDAFHDGGMVTGHERKISASTSGALTDMEDVVGYVFVGSAEEQAQYHQVFETMGKLYPMIEIRYINSFEPQHLQSRQQQDFRDEPCIHRLSWIHYWSAAKESQVLQSKIVNEVVRVRPMWVNTDSLHRNYVPPVLSALASPPASDCDRSKLAPSTLAISTMSSVYLGSSDDGISQSIETSLREVPLTDSIASLLETDSDMDEANLIDICQVHDEEHRRGFERHSPTLRELPEGSILSRTQSALDIRRDGVQSDKSTSSSGRRSKLWSFTALSSSNKRGSYRRSVSTPLLLLTRDGTSSAINGESKKGSASMDTMDPCLNGDTDMSPPPLSPASLSSPSSTSLAGSTASSSSIVSLNIGHRLVGLAQKLGVHKMRGSSLLMMDL
ncbi:hypothetical protein BGZ99_004561 [Dissophora globulifera]|uniref:Uncharacterized protein n=1 Tax=Dissophora globulifera TaxID=979702 RepID=A0A9P6UUW9_9FUNG|nr:hypothetical protein BGZ99_004561 [Dissophora globulifera]